MRNSIEVIINETTYRIQHMNPTKALNLMARISKLIGPGFESLKGQEDKDVYSAIGAGIGMMLSRIDEKSFETLVKDLASGSHIFVNNQPVVFDVHYLGRMGDLQRVLVEVVKFQFGDFIGALIDQVKEKLAQVGASLQTGTEVSPGSSGE